MTTRTTNGHQVTIQTMGEGQGWAKEGTTGAAGAQDMTRLKPSVCFFFTYFCSTNVNEEGVQEFEPYN